MLVIASAPQFDVHQVAATGVQRVEQRIGCAVPSAHTCERTVGAFAIKGPLVTLLGVLMRGQLPDNTTADILPHDTAADLARARIVRSAAPG
jgi:hypothetical protein